LRRIKRAIKPRLSDGAFLVPGAKAAVLTVHYHNENYRTALPGGTSRSGMSMIGFPLTSAARIIP
jgi:hypothetical protein